MVRSLLALSALVVASFALQTEANAQARPVLFEQTHSSAADPSIGLRPHAGITESTLRIELNGAWQRGAERGRLTPIQTVMLRRAAMQTRFVMAPMPRVTCMAMPTRRVMVESLGRRVLWMTPCSQRPDASVERLMQLADRLARPTAPPVQQPMVLAPQPSNNILLRYTETNFRGGPMHGDEDRIVFTDGRWRANGRDGVMSLAELQSLRTAAARAQLRPTAPPFACAAALQGHASIEIAARGSHQWSRPCGAVDASVQSLISQLVRATGGRGPRMMSLK